MKSPLGARVHLMISFVLVTCGAVAGACLGLLLSGRLTALVFAAVAGLGAGLGSFFSRRQVLALFEPDREDVPADGYAEGLADAALVCIATYQAAVFPLTPDGVSEAEREARRTMAYRISAYEGLPYPVQTSAAAALEAIDHGADPKRAESAMKALCLSIYDNRRGR
ncbi:MULTISPECIES: hypothetical protein [Streptomyces]|uniref:Uncharacterized protein n=1 Tax=Streptomyces spororaveus TaxID=284039 RepID=A0ABQ3T3Z0_9ACTN|nr:MULTISPECIES: hypothetical protein [Streptomyces]MCM9077066.1 hypothetical protein [Streptomyces spororaveus]MCX5308279.1 hypothetical protein [Streptomyces sp. NBC_00160]GHI75104.1 hypothetical protein Sspor_06650 [Streptomyces spororaveus]